MIEDSGGKIVRILNLKGNLSNLSKLNKNIVGNEVLKGTVLEVLTDGKALVELNGQKLSVLAETPLVKGQNLQVRIDRLGGNPILKIVPQSLEIKSTSIVSSGNGNSDLSAAQTNLKNNILVNHGRKDNDLIKMNLKPGQTLEAIFLKLLNRETAEVRFQDKTFSAFVSKNTILPKGGEKLFLQVRASAGGLILETSSAMSRTLDIQVLKSYLPARGDFSSLLFALDQKVLNSEILKLANIDPQLIQRLRETLDMLLTKESRDGDILKEQIDRSGINYEAKVKRIIENRITVEGCLELKKDLKGQLLKLQNLLDNFLAKESSKLSESFLNTVREGFSQIKMTTDNIEFNQLSNQFSRRENQPILIQIPDPFFPENGSAKLYFRQEHNEDDISGSKKKEYTLVFILNMSAVGSIRIDTRVAANLIFVKISSESQDVVNLINNNILKLKEKLEEIGYQTEISCCVQELSDIGMEGHLEKAISHNLNGLIDVKI